MVVLVVVLLLLLLALSSLLSIQKEDPEFVSLSVGLLLVDPMETREL